MAQWKRVRNEFVESQIPNSPYALCCVLMLDTSSSVLALVELGKTGNQPNMTKTVD